MVTLIPPQKQKVWGWPAVANFVLGGMGTGLYLWGAFLAATTGGSATSSAVPALVFKLGGAALAGLGLLALTTEAGRPLRGLNLFRHWRRSWMSREALAAAAFIPVAAADWLVPHPALRTVAVLAAATLMVSQGFIPYKARGVTAWNIPTVPVLFITCGLAGGFGLVSLLGAAGQVLWSGGLALLGAVTAFLNVVVWLLYLRRPDPDFQEATRALRSPRSLALIVGVGHVVPIVLLAGLPALAGTLATTLLTLAGALLLVGGLLQKAGLILEASYLRAIRLNSGRLLAQAAPGQAAAVNLLARRPQAVERG